MFRTSLTALAAGVLTLGLVVGAPTAAHAKVKPKDLPSKSQFTKAFPELKGAIVTTDKTKKIGVPAKKCGAVKLRKVTSIVVRTAISRKASPVVSAGVAEFKSKAQAKKYLKAYNKFATKCKKFKHSGVTVKLKKTKAPKIGQQRLAMTQVLSAAGYTQRGATVVVRHGKRVAEVSALDNSKVAPKKVNKLAKVAAKKMR